MPNIIDACPTPIDFEISGCSDSAVVNLNDVTMSSLGRIVQIDTTVKNICPNKRVALAVQLSEVAADGTEQPRGLKVFTVPAHSGTSCEDITVKCIRFVLPEDLDISGGSTTSICNARNFKARVMANYIDTDFVCCETQITMP